AGLLIVKTNVPDAPPPGAGLNTDTWAVPADPMSDARTDACSCVAFTYVVSRLDPFQFTTEPLTNPLPFTVNVNAAVPAVAELGDRDLIAGAWLAAALIVNIKTPELPPPGAGFETDTCTVADAATSVAVIEALSCVALTNVVVRLAPFHIPVEPL